MRAAAGLQVDPGDFDQAHVSLRRVGGLTDIVRTSSGLAASSSSVIQRGTDR